jgi:hypothetical protein
MNFQLHLLAVVLDAEEVIVAVVSVEVEHHSCDLGEQTGGTTITQGCFSNQTCGRAYTERETQKPTFVQRKVKNKKRIRKRNA